ncbi:hypothetical protein NX07_04915 [Xanthomonas vasicola]|nr:hypothetical protein NX07_04915 [Xanthomonas vasicola]
MADSGGVHEQQAVYKRFDPDMGVRLVSLRAQVGYERKPRFHGGTECMAAANLLGRQFDVTEPDTTWASDFTFIRTHAGWMHPAAVIDTRRGVQLHRDVLQPKTPSSGQQRGHQSRTLNSTATQEGETSTLRKNF